MTITEKIEAAKASKQFIDFYCERIAGNFDHGFGEPLNTITNITFIIASALIFREIFKNKLFKLKNFDIVFLAFTLGLIGVGSSIYHATPSNHTELMDVIPISTFIHLYLISFFIRVLKFKIWQALSVFFAFVFVGYWCGANLDPQTLNGTIMYIPTYIMLFVMMGFLYLQEKSSAKVKTKHLALTALIWSFSLTFRTIDIPACEITYGIGTHILWHILNAIVLYRLIVLIIRKNPTIFTFY